MTADQIGIGYLVLSVVVGVVAAVAIWVAAICQSGIVWGGSIGLIPAYFGGLLIAAAWPVIAIAALFWRDEMMGWAETQFEPRRAR